MPSDKPNIRNLRDLGKRVPLNTIVSNLAALGAPGFVLLVAIGSTGLTGAAGVAAALVALGPGGMIGGAITLVLIGLVTRAVSEHGFETVYRDLVDVLFEHGETKQSLRDKIDGYPLSTTLKAVIHEYIDALPDRPSVQIDAIVEDVDTTE